MSVRTRWNKLSPAARNGLICFGLGMAAAPFVPAFVLGKTIAVVSLGYAAWNSHRSWGNFLSTAGAGLGGAIAGCALAWTTYATPPQMQPLTTPTVASSSVASPAAR